MMNRKECGRKQSWPNLRYYPGICLGGLRKTTKKFSQDSRSPGSDLNTGPPLHEAGMLTSRQRRSLRHALEALDESSSHRKALSVMTTSTKRAF
jgi:hypothetical protein